MEWVKKLLSKWWFYLMILGITLLIPFIINEAYKYGKGYVTLWSAEDVLSFYGTYLSFWGTVILGVVAIYQNKTAHRLNQQMQKMQQAQFISMVSVEAVEVKKREVKEEGCSESDRFELEYVDLVERKVYPQYCYYIDVKFKNESSYPIVQLNIYSGNRKNGNYKLYGMKMKEEKSIYIAKNSEQWVRVIVPSLMFEKTGNTQLMFSIDFVNIFDYTTPARLFILNVEDDTKVNNYKFRLSKFIDINPNK